MNDFLPNILCEHLFPAFDYSDECAVIISMQNSQCFADMRQGLPLLLALKKENEKDLIIKSNKLREQGNKLFQAGRKQNALGASRLYTEAIFVAPLDESLALAHANRAAALMEFGYFQQAYDDCECALELGYPENLRVKIWMRQASCAQRLGDGKLLSKHLDVLNSHKLPVNFVKPFEKLKQELQRLLESADGQDMIRDDDVSTVNTASLHRGTHKIVNLNENDRCMIATKFIPKGGLIFEAGPICSVAISKFICHQCAIGLLIPFPCYRCRREVVYCSLKCRRMHQPIHSVECLGYKTNFLPQFEREFRLAFRLVIEHFPKVVATLRYTPSAKKIWRELTAKGGLVHSANSAYAQILAMKTYLEKQTKGELLRMSLKSCLLLEYLSGYTNFFDMNVFEGTRVRRDDWILIVGSLILRLTLQIRRSVIYSVSISRCAVYSIGFDLMSEKLWAKPWHIRCGLLHQFQFQPEQFFAMCPHNGLNRHNCERSFDIKYSGRSIRTFAIKPIEVGEEIFDCYGMDYRIANKQARNEILRKNYDFTCECSRCTDPAVEEYCDEAFHRFRCEKMDCRKSFVAPFIQNRSWYIREVCTITPMQLRCPYCKSLQSNLCKLEKKLIKLLPRLQYQNQRHQLFKSYEALDNYLVHLNVIKLNYTSRILQLLSAVDVDFHIRKTESPKLINMGKFLLRGGYAMFGHRSEIYATAMTYLWDIIALGKYKPEQNEMTEMLETIEVLPDDMNKIFKNYYNDFIADKFKG